LVTSRELISRLRSEGRTQLTEVEAKELLKQSGIPVVDTRLAVSRDEAISIGADIGFPVVLKIVSPDIIHKSDAGGVMLNLETPEQLANAYNKILDQIKRKYPEARIHGVSIQKMANPGLEVIMGMSKDPQFGSVLMFGLGGILVEILKDISFRIIPLTRKDAREMLREIKGSQLFKGYRGQAPVDTSKLEEMILNVSNFVEQYPEVKELDLNPVIISGDSAIAVDARVVLEEVTS
jgi:acyl-CoA synthetase (NDP forming)